MIRDLFGRASRLSFQSRRVRANNIFFNTLAPRRAGALLFLFAALVGASSAQAQSVASIAAGAHGEVCDLHPQDCLAARQTLSERMAQDSPKMDRPKLAQAADAPARPSGAVPFGGLAKAAGREEDALRFGMIAPLSGPNKDFGAELRLGASTAFAVANDAGGVAGHPLRLVAADDGYDPARTPDIAKTLFEKDKVIGFLSNFGSATSAAILPYVLEHKLVFFGAYSGAPALRKEPPDRYVFNYRASYAEETEAIARYLVRVRRLHPSQIAVFTQDDAFGDAGFIGVEKALRAMNEDDGRLVLRLRYARNSIDVAGAIAELHKNHDIVTSSTKKIRERVAVAVPVAAATGDAAAGAPAKPATRTVYREREKTVTVKSSQPGVKAVIMVATYRAAAKFIEKARELYPDMIFTNVSAVGANNLADELKLLGPAFAKDVIVTQVTPDPAGYSSLALEYRTALGKYFPGEHADYVSFESYINAKILIEGLKRAAAPIDAESIVAGLEGLHGLDIGLGVPVSLSASEHQAAHRVWGMQLDQNATYQALDLE